MRAEFLAAWAIFKARRRKAARAALLFIRAPTSDRFWRTCSWCLRPLSAVLRPYVCESGRTQWVDLIRSGYPPAMAAICANLPYETDSGC
jgi:hypothetical protein